MEFYLLSFPAMKQAGEANACPFDPAAWALPISSGSNGRNPWWQRANHYNGDGSLLPDAEAPLPPAQGLPLVATGAPRQGLVQQGSAAQWEGTLNARECHLQFRVRERRFFGVPSWLCSWGFEACTLVEL